MVSRGQTLAAVATILPVSIVLILIAVGVHYEALSFGSRWLGKLPISPRIRVLLAVLLTLCAHFAEVVLFAIGWYALLATDMAALSGVVSGPTDVLYFSLVTYTSLGYGDIAPLGPARLLAGIESLIGLGLIAWSASFTYLEMQRYWYAHNGN